MCEPGCNLLRQTLRGKCPARLSEGNTMLRLLIAAGLMCVSTVSLAQVVREVKPALFGGGCETPATSFARKLGTCKVTDNQARVFCPNGKVFERAGPEFTPALARSICGLNQVL